MRGLRWLTRFDVLLRRLNLRGSFQWEKYYELKNQTWREGDPTNADQPITMCSLKC